MELTFEQIHALQLLVNKYINNYGGRHHESDRSQDVLTLTRSELETLCENAVATARSAARGF